MEDNTDFKSTIRNSILILLFEFIGTTFLTLLYICSNQVSTQKKVKINLSNPFSVRK
jgi:formate/nitrite transporter FocA (FNT family)